MLDLDGVGVLLAQRLVLLGEEGLALQSGAAHCADEAGIVPGKAKGIEEPITCLNGELTAMAPSPKQVVEIWFTVWLSILQVESVVSDWLLARRAQEAVAMPSLL